MLGAQRAAYDELREQARGGGARAARLIRRGRPVSTAIARGRLGDHAVVREQPGGGLVAETSDGRRVDASVHALVDSAVADLDLEQLWAP